MKFAAKSATALALLLAVSACGGGAPEEAETAAPSVAATDATATPTDTATAAATETPAPTDTPSDAPSATPTPTATPTKAPAAAPTTAAMTEPASFAQCKACHSVEPGKHGIGPSLAGIWGDKAGDIAGYDFSDAMKASGLTWNQANLDRFIADPKGTVPGNKMPFGGVKDAAKRQEIINYIKSL